MGRGAGERKKKKRKNLFKTNAYTPPPCPQTPDTIQKQLNRGPATRSSRLNRTGYFAHRPLHRDPAGSWSNLLNQKGRRGWGGGGEGQRGPRRHLAQSSPEAEAANWKSFEKA